MVIEITCAAIPPILWVLLKKKKSVDFFRYNKTKTASVSLLFSSDSCLAWMNAPVSEWLCVGRWLCTYVCTRFYDLSFLFVSAMQVQKKSISTSVFFSLPKEYLYFFKSGHWQGFYFFSSVSQKWLNILENASLREFSIWNGRDGSQTKEAINVDNKNKVMRRLQPEPWLMLWIHALQVFAMNTYLNTTRPVPRISSKCRTFPVFSVMMAETDACRLQCFVHPDFWRVCWIFGHIAGEFTWSRTGFKEINSAFCPKSPAFLQKTK